MGKSRKKTKKNHPNFQVNGNANQAPSEGRRRLRSASHSSLDGTPKEKKRKNTEDSPKPQLRASGGSSESITELVKSVEEGMFSKLATGPTNMKGVESPIPHLDSATSEMSEGASHSTHETDTNEASSGKSCATPKQSSKNHKTTPRSLVKTYGMPQVIQGKILGETNDSIYLKLKKSITICGKAYIRALKGTVNVAGYKIQASARKYPIYSPNCCALLTISVMDTQATNVENVSENIRKKILEVDAKSAVIEMSKLSCPKCDYVTSFEKNKHVFLSPGYPLPVVETRIITDKLPTLIEDPTHKEAADAICQLITSGSLPTVMLCGGKNAGKSTFCRYLLNRVLSVKGCDEVAFLECDVGQTEFTPSSFVSLSTVTEPLLGPPFTHNAWPRSAVFYGHATPAKDAHGYMDCVRKMHNAYKNLTKQVPLIVNTMGWNKGLGLRLFIDTLRLTDPTHIIQIDHPSDGRDFPDMTPDFVEETDGFTTCAGEKSHHEVLHIPSLLNLKTEWTGKFTPKDHRNLIFFSYFGASVTKTVPYEVPWGEITVLIDNPLTSAAQILNVLNGSVVGLCVIPDHQLPTPADSDDVNSAPRILVKNSHYTPLCKGLGIIRSIDPERRVFHVISPVPLPQLAHINCFKVGALTLPEQLITTQKVTEALPRTIPYFGEYKDTMGSSKVVKPRHMARGKKP